MEKQQLEQARIESEKARWSPWTGRQADLTLKKPDYMGLMMQGMSAGGMMGQGMGGGTGQGATTTSPGNKISYGNQTPGSSGSMYA